MTQKVLSDISIPSPNTAIGASSKPKNEGSKEEFLSLMSQNVAAMPASSVNPATKAQTNGGINLDSDDKQAAFESFKESSSYANSTKIESKDSIDTLSEEEISAIQEEISEYEEDIKSIISEKMDVSEEEIEEAMETLGLTFLDLSDPSKLAALLDKLSGGEQRIDLLLDTSVKDIFTEIGALSNELFESTGLDSQELLTVVADFDMQDAEGLLTPTLETDIKISDDEIPVEVEEGEVLNNRVNRYENTDIKTEDVPEEVDEVAGAIKNIVTEHSQTKDSNLSNQGGNTQQNNTTTPIQTEVSNENIMPVSDRAFTLEKSDDVQDVRVPVYTNVNATEVVEQIVTAARVNITETVRMMEMELNPHNLGKMIMQVSENEGQVSAKFFTQNEAVKTALEGAIQHLIEKLAESGIKVDAVEVSVGTHEFESNLEDQFASQAREDLSDSDKKENQGQSRGGINLSEGDYDESELTEEEALEVSMMRTYGNTLNYRA